MGEATTQTADNYVEHGTETANWEYDGTSIAVAGALGAVHGKAGGVAEEIAEAATQAKPSNKVLAGIAGTVEMGAAPAKLQVNEMISEEKKAATQ